MNLPVRNEILTGNRGHGTQTIGSGGWCQKASHYRKYTLRSIHQNHWNTGELFLIY